MTVHEEVLPGRTKEALYRLAESGTLGPAYLAGGTAVALQLGHRVSHDLDFFSPEAFDERMLVQRLEAVGLVTEQQSWQTIAGSLWGVKVGYYFYRYPLLFPPTPYAGVPLADLRDGAGMKVEAIAARGTRRDFVDLFALMTALGLSLDAVMDVYRRKYGSGRDTLVHALKSLTYFDDAEGDAPLSLLRPIAWDEVKHFFLRAAPAYGRKLFAG
jgi:hypothetical protein